MHFTDLSRWAPSTRGQPHLTLDQSDHTVFEEVDQGYSTVPIAALFAQATEHAVFPLVDQFYAKREFTACEEWLNTAVQPAKPDEVLRTFIVAVEKGEVAPRNVIAEVSWPRIRERASCLVIQLARQVSNLLVVREVRARQIEWQHRNEVARRDAVVEGRGEGLIVKGDSYLHARAFRLRCSIGLREHQTGNEGERQGRSQNRTAGG